MATGQARVTSPLPLAAGRSTTPGLAARPEGTDSPLYSLSPKTQQAVLDAQHLVGLQEGVHSISGNFPRRGSNPRDIAYSPIGSSSKPLTTANLQAPQRTSSVSATYSISPSSGSNQSNEAAAGHFASPAEPQRSTFSSMNAAATIGPSSTSFATRQITMQPPSPSARIVGLHDTPGTTAGSSTAGSSAPDHGMGGTQPAGSIDSAGTAGQGGSSAGHGNAGLGLGPNALASQMGGLGLSSPGVPAMRTPGMQDGNSNGFNGAPQPPHLHSNNSYNGGISPSLQSFGGTTAMSNPSQHGHSNSMSTYTPSTSVAATGATAPYDEVIPTSFDESTLRALCDMDCGMPLLYDRIKQSMISANHAAVFFKKRAMIEEEYGRSMIKMARSTMEAYATTEAKAGTFVNTWQSVVKTHENIGEDRLRFAQKLSEISDELTNLAKEVDKNRKYARDTGVRLEKNLTDAEASVEKARGRFDAAAEDLERLLLLKSGESTKGGELQGTSSSNGAPKRTLGKAIGKSSLLFKNKNPQQILKQEEEVRARTAAASDAFRKEVQATQTIRSDYFRLQLPRILRSLKESSEEIDNGLQYHLSRYAFLYESVVLADGTAISPVSTVDGSTGLKSAVDTIDNRADFKQFMQNYQVLHGRDYKGPKREGPYDEGYAQQPIGGAYGSAAGPSKGAGFQQQGGGQRAIFGVSLSEQMERDGVDVPPILEKCAEAIEQFGIENKGIYRLSGTTSKVQRLKAQFDADWMAVDLMKNDEALGDINIVAGCLKLWFRELPEPLMTWELYGSFMEAAKIENDRLRHIRMHERVNDLPDANYATLKYLMGHLDKIRKQEHLNQMSASNLAIVFGPTLLTPPPPGSGIGNASGGPMGSADMDANANSNAHLQDMQFQCKAVETILDRYEAIFVDENE